MSSCISLHQKIANRLKSSFIDFLSVSFETINPSKSLVKNWHLQEIAKIIESIKDGKIKRLIVNIPPRNLKSVCFSAAFPAWMMANDPATRVLVSSYSMEISLRHSKDSRSIMTSSWYKKYFHESLINDGFNTIGRFGTEKNGYRFACSVGGSITGDGGDVLIIDDPHNPIDIFNKDSRDRVYDWFQNVWMSRLNSQKDGVVVIVMQRLHEDDLVGRLLKNNNEGWSVLSIPAIAYEDTNIYFKNKILKKMKKGEPIDVQRYTSESIESIQKSIGIDIFWSQYMQDPKPCVKGSILKGKMIIKEDSLSFNLSDFEVIALSIDCATGIGKKQDYSVCFVFGIKNSKHYILDVHRSKESFLKFRSKVFDMIKAYNPSLAIVEVAANGSALASEIKTKGLHLVTIRPLKSKVARLYSVIRFFENGKIHSFLDSEKFYQLKKEIESFPNSANDDQVDSITQYLSWYEKTCCKDFNSPSIRSV